MTDTLIVRPGTKKRRPIRMATYTQPLDPSDVTWGADHLGETWKKTTGGELVRQWCQKGANFQWFVMYWLPTRWEEHPGSDSEGDHGSYGATQPHLAAPEPGFEIRLKRVAKGGRLCLVSRVLTTEERTELGAQKLVHMGDVCPFRKMRIKNKDTYTFEEDPEG